MVGSGGARRRWLALALAAGSIGTGVLFPGRAVPGPADPRPNIVLILTDDQTADSLPHEPPVMPFLQARIEDPGDHWVAFASAFVNTPLCCPSRASLLTGRYSHETGVRTNLDGAALDEGDVLPVWLHRSGYRTAMIGKYLNEYPFDGLPSVPPGWDEWLAKRQGAQSSAYYDYAVVNRGATARHGTLAADYSTDVFADAAVDFIRTAPPTHPFFLLVAPTAPHRPWTPAPRDAGAYASMPVAVPANVGEPDVSDKPGWVGALPPMTPERVAQLREIRRRAYETLRAVDRLVARVLGALEARGLLDRTVVFFLTDNGMSLGEHRWVGKTCPYEECVRTPLVVRYPSATARVDDHLVSNVDLAPTIAELAAVDPGRPFDGMSLVPLLEGYGDGWREAVLLEYAGDVHVPAWWGLRTERFALIEYVTGERELYDLSSDPLQLWNRALDPEYSAEAARLAELLAALRPT